MRVVLFTGKGGVGKTTVAAATALQAAAQGHKTLVMSTDRAHSLSDVLAVAPSADPEEIAPGLFAQHVDSQRRMQESWGSVNHFLNQIVVGSGLSSVVADEITVLPGTEQLLALLEVRDQIRSGRFDAVIVDCAPTAETLRLLALPEIVQWYLQRLVPPNSRVARSLRPLLGRLLDPAEVALPDPEVFDALAKLQAEVQDVADVLADAHTTVRVVLTPESVVVAESRRAVATLGLFGYDVDGVVVNRVFPPPGDVHAPFWVNHYERQGKVLEDVATSFGYLPQWRLEFAVDEPTGIKSLEGLADRLYRDDDALADRSESGAPIVERHGDRFQLTMSLPHVTRSDVELTRVNDELVITLAGFRRVLALPAALQRCEITNAHLREGRLVVEFVPDQRLWPARSGTKTP